MAFRVRRIPRGIHGANVVPLPVDVVAPLSWLHFWGTNWAANYAYAKAQIDLAAAHGWNTIRVIGDCQAVTGGAIDLATYLSRVELLVRHCRYRGLWYYACGGSFDDYSAANSVGGCTPAQMAAVVGPLAGLLARYGHVIGIDVIQETAVVMPTLDTAANYRSATAAAVRAAAPNLPLTFSIDGNFGNLVVVGDIQQYWDFGDWHLYNGPYTAASADGPVAALAGKPLLIGETGQPANAGSSTIAAHFASARNVVARPECYGSLLWAIAPQDAEFGPTDYGAYGSDNSPRQAILDGFDSMPNRPVRAYPLRRAG